MKWQATYAKAPSPPGWSCDLGQTPALSVSVSSSGKWKDGTHTHHPTEAAEESERTPVSYIAAASAEFKIA